YFVLEVFELHASEVTFLNIGKFGNKLNMIIIIIGKDNLNEIKLVFLSCYILYALSYQIFAYLNEGLRNSLIICNLNSFIYSYSSSRVFEKMEKLLILRRHPRTCQELKDQDDTAPILAQSDPKCLLVTKRGMDCSLFCGILKIS
ncbi:hypothetical protein Avbf_01131, partial [Armadillidium vulgare]